MKVLSLFDGMACGALALQAAGIEIERYDAFEIDEYAIKTAKHNFPFIEHHGDVFKADFTEFEGVDLVCGGSPCTYWSIAQKKDCREVEASGMGWELFQQYVRAVKEAKPKFFVYENNKSMSQAIRDSIDEAFGFEAIHINSALVSAQNRNRLYWVGKRNADGTYSKVEIEQPEDKGILLKDILEHGVAEKEKAYCLMIRSGNTRDYFKKRHSQVVFEPVRIGDIGSTAQAHRVYSCCGKTVTMSANGGGQGGKTGLYFVPLPESLQGLVCDKGKIYTVKDHKIETKSGTWDVNLPDGLYLIRKLTVREAARCQTIPDWYDFSVVSDTQAYKQIGNGWTVDVIAHLFTHLKGGESNVH